MTMQREYPQAGPNQPEGSFIPRLRNAENIDLRFDRIEERLASLEQMLGQFLNSKCEPPTSADRVAIEPQLDATPMPRNPVSSTPVPPTSQHEDDAELDASVRDYVERLLRKDGSNPTPAPLELEPPADAPVVAERSGTTAWPDALEEATPAAGRKNADETTGLERSENLPDLPTRPSDLIPLRLPPEREANLDALREVAKLSATAAIRTFERSQAVRNTADRLPLLLIGAACGLMLLYSAVASGQTALFVGAGAAFVGAALTGSQLLVILRRWLAASQPVETR